MVYHVTDKWDGGDLETGAQRYGEAVAIEKFCEKWDTDSSLAILHVHSIFFYRTFEEAERHQKNFGGEVLEIDDECIDLQVDTVEGHLFTYDRVPAHCIRRTSIWPSSEMKKPIGPEI